MVLAQARALSIKYVKRGGEQFPKTGPFNDEQLKAEDWEPVQDVPDDMKAQLPKGDDCGCGPELKAAKK